jgi:hypothetical protein
MGFTFAEELDFEWRSAFTACGKVEFVNRFERARL